jgi:NTE family protein
MVFGVNWIFERSRIGDFVAGYCEPGNTTIAEAVAASSCFPPVFQPMPVSGKAPALRRGKYPIGASRDSLLRGLSLTDGGVYDNMGLEPVWKNHSTIIVSDGGASFQFQLSRTPMRRLLYYNGIIGDQASKVRRRWLMPLYLEEKIEGAFWSVSSAVDNYDPGAPGYSTKFAKGLIGRIRTDMDAFSEGEAKVLENHGFTLADVALRCHTPRLLTTADPLHEPHPDWINEKRASAVLRYSHKRRWIGRYNA